MLRTLFAAALLAASPALYAQQQPDIQKRPRFDCSKAKDPKACEERVARAKAAHAKARAACEGKPEAERRDCVRREMCAQAKDPAKCEASVKARAAQRAKIREACKDRKGEELRSCIREQRQRKPG
jgi:Spy/CpxP family protein refolding chaperone